MSEQLPSYLGRGLDAGRIVIGQQYPREGYAGLRCGGTEIVLGYTTLHNLHFRPDPASHYWKEHADFLTALDHIKAEASMGRTPYSSSTDAQALLKAVRQAMYEDEEEHTVVCQRIRAIIGRRP